MRRHNSSKNRRMQNMVIGWNTSQRKVNTSLFFMKTNISMSFAYEKWYNSHSWALSQIYKKDNI